MFMYISFAQINAFKDVIDSIGPIKAMKQVARDFPSQQIALVYESISATGYC